MATDSTRIGLPAVPYGGPRVFGGYNRRVNPVSRHADSTPDIEERLIQKWRGMSAEQKLTISMSMSQAVRNSHSPASGSVTLRPSRASKYSDLRS
jgi:hypothetical protein